MLNLFTFLVVKLTILSNLNFFESKWSDIEQQGRAKPSHSQRFKRGDLLEVPRTLFTHFGIYLGDDRVAHLIPDILPVLTDDARLIDTVITNQRLIMGCMFRCATVRVDSLQDFAYGSEILVNAMDSRMSARALLNEEVAKRAEQLIGAIPYSLLWNNCEHVATYCRYGSAVSLQTDKFCEWLKSVIRDRRSIIVAVLIGITSIVCYGLLPSTTLPTVIIPFTLWMAS
ncbi:lecithin retinol acyltransferase a [Gadus morhua]|uniref:Lecithin retinol acyltransferase n=1 Tax=Gadus morhua TaxID=8049 RepID=A0A8C5BHA5_GADMO|nr:lecithin retinol acyltransferase-like [Gadus morhua]XP_056442537.1 lecithin retinol acyltransferase a [Gadus chalcogrammus]